MAVVHAQPEHSVHLLLQQNLIQCKDFDSSCAISIEASKQKVHNEVRDALW